MNGIYICGMSTNIDGDERYTDTLEVFYKREDDTILIIAKCCEGRAGTQLRVCDAKAGDLLKTLREVVREPLFNFKKYGKPTKNFHWRKTAGGEPLKGLSIAHCYTILEWVKANVEVLSLGG